MKVTQAQPPDMQSSSVVLGHVASYAAAPTSPTFLPLVNSDAIDLVEGDVVVVQDDGTVIRTTIAEDPRPKGVVLDDIAVGEGGPVQFVGPVDVVNLTASGTAGEYIQTSTTAGQADATTDKGAQAFGYLTSSGTSPSAFLFGSGAEGLTIGDITAVTDDLYLTKATGELHVPDTITAGAAQTLDLSTANTFDVTLTAACTITLSNPPASGVEGRWTIVLRQDATGSRTVTWPAAVKWRAANGTQTATAPTLATTAAAMDTIDLRTLDGGATYGASLENGGSGGGSFATPAIVLGTAAAAGAASTTIRSDSTIVAFDTTVPVTQAFSDTATTGSAAVAARRDHKHGMPAASGVGEILISDTPSTPLVFADLLQNEAQDDLIYADP
jgi:hypothetical protein